jgi:hypothetical protein
VTFWMHQANQCNNQQKGRRTWTDTKPLLLSSMEVRWLKGEGSGWGASRSSRLGASFLEAPYFAKGETNHNHLQHKLWNPCGMGDFWWRWFMCCMSELPLRACECLGLYGPAH